MCEDFPCCGHDDGLGCDWVSPNEVQPCNDCIEARASYPYHTMLDQNDCPTFRAKMREIPADAVCYYADEVGGDVDCDGEADYNYGGHYLCNNCYVETKRGEEYDRDIYETYHSR